MDHPDTILLDDIVHRCANELKSVLSSDETWNEFSRLVNRFKREVQQTPLAPLSPPSQRGKARHMNVDVLMKWCREILVGAVKNPDLVAAHLQCDVDVVRSKVAWAKPYLVQITLWDELCTTVDVVLHVVRLDGYCPATPGILKEMLPSPCCDAAKNLQTRLIDFVTQQSMVAAAAAGPSQNQRIPGSSEVIESLLGTFKAIEGEQARSGLTSTLLAIPAATAWTTADVVCEALEAVTSDHVRTWARDKLGKTVQAARRAIRGILEKEEKQDQFLPQPAP